MRRTILLLGLAAAIAAIAAPAAIAGHPHFIAKSFEADRTGDSLTVSGKEAGLGDEDQVHIVLSATAVCINRGGKHPKAANKQSVSAEEDFPVQNGQAEFTLTFTADFQPDCSPPMSVEFRDVRVTDTTNGISKQLGNF
jgi:hypothetical protein